MIFYYFNVYNRGVFYVKQIHAQTDKHLIFRTAGAFTIFNTVRTAASFPGSPGYRNG